ncbi:MAG: LuxR family transcriptional regulator [Hyphomicrobiales bacterium]|nr:LuxR family transcriptional regulator [Hyphomicrobiales bacterium]
MTVDENIAAIEGCGDQATLEVTLQRIVESYGFHSYCFLDIGKAYSDEPFYVGTTGADWEREYVSNDFVHVDECLSMARRTNRPFDWGRVPLPVRSGQRKPGALQVMEAATDHGFQQGLDVPFHFVDSLGRLHSSNCVLMWKDSVSDFTKVRDDCARELHLVLVYWMQRLIELRMTVEEGPATLEVARINAHKMRITDKEREVIAWAARGKTASDTAEIMSIATETVRWYTKKAIEKMNAGNKTHAVAKAIHLGLIDL